MATVKLFAIAAAAACAVQTVVAQVKEGVILYETKINTHRNIPPERSGMKAMVPEFRTLKHQLFFNESESLFKPVIEEVEEEFTSEGMRMRFITPQVETYANVQDQKSIVSQEFMGKKYLITDTLKTAPWKLGTETKNILGYECKQAYMTTEIQVMLGPQAQSRTVEITAWYTDKIRPWLGPEHYNTLPGTVLAVDVNGGEKVILAVKLEERPLRKNELKIPASGTKVSQAEFRKIVAAQMEKMRQSGGNPTRN